MATAQQHTGLQRMGFTLMLSVLILALLLPLVSPSASAAGALQAFGTDTVAGYEAALSTSQTAVNRDIVFTVTKPTGQIVTISAKTGVTGVAALSLYDYHTRKAGIYTVSARFADGAGVSAGPTSFTVYPDEVSVQDSVVTADRNIVRSDGSDVARITVQLKDAYGNAFQGHAVSLISSRPDDTVTAVTSGSVTDEAGVAAFTVSSVKGGVSVLSALDSTSGKVLEARAQVAFVKDSSTLGLTSSGSGSGSSYGPGVLPDAGGDLLAFVPKASAQSTGTVSQFELSGIPATVQANQNVSFRITAQDQAGVTVENYTGTVHFSVTGENNANVSLPEDFTFKAENLGTHQFSLGLRFPSQGTFTIVATDINNQLVTGEVDVTVGSGSGTGSSGSAGSGSRPVITSPQPGVSSQNTQTFSGTASPGTDLTILDNRQEIGVAQVTPSGTFSFTTSTPLSDGDHVFEIEALNASGQLEATSLPLNLTIDTKAPLLEDIQISPSTGITPGDLLNVEVYSNEALFDSALVFDNDIFELEADSTREDVYIATIAAPLQDGEYPLDAVLVDELGNEETYTEAATVVVAEDGSGSASDNGGGTPPSQVFGVVAYGSANRVTLLWEAATDDTQVDHYRVTYGTDPNLLDQSVDTIDAATTWYIPNLENGTEYFFVVFAVDEDGNESLTGSELVTGIPFSLEVEGQVPDRPDGAVSSAGEDNALLRGSALNGRVPGSLSEQGPEILWLLGGSGLASTLLRRKKKASRK